MVTLLRTKHEMDDRVLAEISETHESKEDEGRTVEVIEAGDCVFIKTPRGGNGKPQLSIFPSY